MPFPRRQKLLSPEVECCTGPADHIHLSQSAKQNGRHGLRIKTSLQIAINCHNNRINNKLHQLEIETGFITSTWRSRPDNSFKTVHEN